MLKDKDGNRLFRKVTVRVVFPDEIFPPRLFTQRAGPHQGFGPEGIDAMLMSIADQLDTLYPFWEFKAVELLPDGRTARFAFTFAGYRSTKINPKESSTLGPETAEDSTPTEAKTEVGIPSAVPPFQE